jgi:diadenosine tetraphosphate (Ap4A) HIT family hydrolase
MLATKRHGCDGPWSLDEAEMAELGPLIGRVSSAIRRAGHDWMYVMNFGDNTPKAHYHLGFFSRWQAIPAAVQQVFRARLDDASASGMDLAVEFAAEMRSQLS